MLDGVFGVLFRKAIFVEVVAVFNFYFSVLANQVIYGSFVPKDNLKSSAVRQGKMSCYRWCHRSIILDVVLVVLEAMLRALDVVDEVVHVQLVIEGLGDRPSSVPVGGMENDGSFHDI